MVREEMRKKEVKRNEEVIKGWGERESRYCCFCDVQLRENCREKSERKKMTE